MEARYVRVGGLIVVGLLVLIYGVYRVGKIFDVFAERYTLVTLLPSVAGLREGSMVALAGQQVGQVDEIKFIPMHQKRGGSHLAVRIKVAERARGQIRRDSKIQVRALGLLGDKYIDIEPGTATVAALQPGDTIRAEISIDMGQFLELATQAVEQANLVVADLRVITGSLARGDGTMGQLLHDQQLYFRMVSATGEMQTLLEQINNGDGALSRLIQDPELYRKMASAVARVDSLGAGILHGDGTLAQMIRSDSLYRGMAGTAAKADRAAGELSALLQRLNQTDGSLNRLMTDPRLFDEFLKSVIDLQTLIADVRANPKKYVPPVNVKVF
jgi:phospholipid/cholesterol/gamma-HCH transport system substrate-binding protein